MITVVHSTIPAERLTPVAEEFSDFPPGTLCVPKTREEFRQERQLPDGSWEATYNFVYRQGTRGAGPR